MRKHEETQAMSEKLLCPHCENDLADPCIWCREEALKARVEELESENHELKVNYVCGVPWIDHEEDKNELRREIERLTEELRDLRRKVGEWARILTPTTLLLEDCMRPGRPKDTAIGSLTAMEREMREEAGK